MARTSPLAKLHQMTEATMQPYGPIENGDAPLAVVATFGELELEYAALRKHSVLLDSPQRGVVEVIGADRLSFLNRMITHELKDLSPFRMVRSFWLNRKGRIDADMRVLDLPDRTLLEMDVLAVGRAIEGLTKYVITEDVRLADATSATHRLSLHGPTSLFLLQAIAQHTIGPNASGPAFEDLLPGRAVVVRIAEADVVVARDDTAGVVGLELIMGVKDALRVYEALLAAGRHHEAEPGQMPAPNPWRNTASRARLRPAGWHAWNMARIEAGTPLYNIDFGSESLPAETGVLADRVSFTKGCYLGQEVVARMHARGHPKQLLVGVKFETRIDPATQLPAQPGEDAHLRLEDGNAVGAISSSTLAPMLGSAPIALASVKFEQATPGTVLTSTGTDGQTLKGVVQPRLSFLPEKA